MSDELPDEILKNADTSKAIPPLYGALLKNEQDVQLLERLAFHVLGEIKQNKCLLIYSIPFDRLVFHVR
jgi:hypothetical protein